MILQGTCHTHPPQHCLTIMGRTRPGPVNWRVCPCECKGTRGHRGPRTGEQKAPSSYPASFWDKEGPAGKGPGAGGGLRKEEPLWAGCQHPTVPLGTLGSQRQMAKLGFPA